VAPEKLLADTLYGSDDNERISKVAEVDLIAPAPKGHQEDQLSKFGFDENGLDTQCPAGHRPDTTSPKTKRSNYGTSFDLKPCLSPVVSMSGKTWQKEIVSALQ
jgi:hypothetical protein